VKARWQGEVGGSRENERLATRLEAMARPGEAGDWERIVAHALRYGSQALSEWDALAEARRLVGQEVGEDGNGNGPDEPAAPSTWTAVNLAPILAGEDVDEPPTQLKRIDGMCLLYPGKLHVVHGEPETAKGWLCLHAASEEISKGNHVFCFDFEDLARTAVARSRALGLSDEAIAEFFHYVRPNEPLNEASRIALQKQLGAHRPSLVIIDGVTEALTLEGLSLSDNTEVAQWMEQLPRWVRDKTEAAIVLIDHVTKDREARGRFAIGAQHKLAGVDVAYSVKVVEVLGRGLRGRIEVKVTKDRPGHVRQHATDDVIAEVDLESQADGAMAIVVQPPDPKGWRPTKRMEEISRFLEGNDGASQRAIRESVGGKVETTIEAIQFLIGDGYVRVVEKGQTSHHHTVRPYRATGSQTPGTTSPVSSGSEEPGSAGGSGSPKGGEPGNHLADELQGGGSQTPGTTREPGEPPLSTGGRSGEPESTQEVLDYRRQRGVDLHDDGGAA
jgi:hypothetical protein